MVDYTGASTFLSFLKPSSLLFGTGEVKRAEKVRISLLPSLVSISFSKGKIFFYTGWFK